MLRIVNDLPIDRHAERSDVGSPPKGIIVVDRRKREIRQLMAETGMDYTRAARELDRRAEPEPSPMDESDDKLGSNDYGTGLSEFAEQLVAGHSAMIRNLDAAVSRVRLASDLRSG